jgi:glutamyl-tRNA synthetase
MEITHVLRGHDWLPSTPLHLMIYEAFGWTPPAFCHLPVVVGSDGKKLSKRHGSTRVLEFRDRGYLPEALINYLARVGWSYDDKRELFTLAELEQLFTLSKVNKAPAVFDYAKLEWLNAHYIREKTSQELYDVVLPFVVESGVVGPEPTEEERTTLLAAMPLIQERLKYLTDAPDLVRFVFHGPAEYAVTDLIPKKGSLADVRDALQLAAPIVARIDELSDEELEQRFRATAEESGTKLGNLLMPLRVAITGSRVSPPLFGSIRLIGHERASGAVAAALSMVEQAIERGE